MFRCEPGDCSGSAVMLPPHPQTTAPPPTTTSLAIQQTQRESAPVVQEPCPAEHYYEKSKKECVKGYCDQKLPNEDEPKAICEEGQAIPRETCGEYKLCQKGYWIDGVCDGNLAFVDNVCGPDKCEKDHIDPKYVTSAQCVHQALQTGSDEQSYRYCYYGNWVERKCPLDHIFNWQLLKCMPKEEEYEPYRPKCPPGTRKRFENSTDIYEECEEEMWVRKYCAYGQVFINGYCTVPVENPSYEKESHSKEEKPEYSEDQNDAHDDKDDKYDKGDKDGDYSKPTYHNPATEYCVMSGGRDGYRRVPHDCSKFYQCVHGKWMEMPCAPGTFWNEAISVCDHIGNVPGCGRPGQKYIY
ncbi:hypothetical protein WR25_01498 [Diploscapter pachys]|uniref:Chitin-binding type-2 domain-containing protein n=1 Tax=Diploscapter pachys TaxID=2018661 RepID=A0A2A2JRB0_9BILA|nr:hypothetical protein WR25_01498 [Diploscapter pachys]